MMAACFTKVDAIRWYVAAAEEKGVVCVYIVQTVSVNRVHRISRRVSVNGTGGDCA